MMGYRPDINGMGQALSCDITTTGARLIPSIPLNQVNIIGFGIIRLGDKTTPCPTCGKVGRVVECDEHHSFIGINVAVDRCKVACGCPDGSNRIIAPLDSWLGSGPSPEQQEQERQAALLVKQKAAEQQ